MTDAFLQRLYQRCSAASLPTLFCTFCLNALSPRCSQTRGPSPFLPTAKVMCSSRTPGLSPLTRNLLGLGLTASRGAKLKTLEQLPPKSAVSYPFPPPCISPLFPLFPAFLHFPRYSPAFCSHRRGPSGKISKRSEECLAGGRDLGGVVGRRRLVVVMGRCQNSLLFSSYFDSKWTQRMLAILTNSIQISFTLFEE